MYNDKPYEKCVKRGRYFALDVFFYFYWSMIERRKSDDIFFFIKLNSFFFRWHLLVPDILIHRLVVIIVDENIDRIIVLTIDLDVIVIMMYEQFFRTKSTDEHVFFRRRKNDLVEVVLGQINVDVRIIDIQLPKHHHRRHPTRNNEKPIVRLNSMIELKKKQIQRKNSD